LRSRSRLGGLCLASATSAKPSEECNAHLLFIASLGEKAKLHMARPMRNLRSISLLDHTRVTLSGAHGQGNVKSSLALLASVHALRHELRKFAVEVCLELRVALVFLAFDDDLLVLLAMLAMRRIVPLLLLVWLVMHRTSNGLTSEFSVEESSASSSSSSSESESSSPSSSTAFSRTAGCW
jgi:energy-converting hydrogenase Eha subunit E